MGSKHIRRMPNVVPYYVVVLLFSPLALGGCHSVVLEPAGPVAGAEKSILIDSMAIMLAIVVPTIVVALGVAWWFRASNRRATYRPRWEFSGQIELVVWSIPLMVITLLGGVAWIGSHKLDPAIRLEPRAQAIEIDVVSLDWKWLFIYPEQNVAAVNQLTVPSGVPLRFRLTSASVMNAFFIPQLGSMIYTMAGMTTELNLSSEQTGTFRGISSHYSGEGFSDMHFETHVVSAAEFDTWIASARGAQRRLDAAGYTELAKQSMGVAPTLYGAVDAGLFDKIVTLQLPTGPGPSTEHAGARQSATEP
jgi:cytochrome o ubiquinol oxidase subunit 2